MYVYIHTYLLKNHIVPLKKTEEKKFHELKFEITGLFFGLKASPSFWICFEIICFENVCILKEAILFLPPLPQNSSVFKVVNLTC